MNIYLIKRRDECDYDEYDSAVVVAETEQDARNTHPAGTGAKWGRIEVMGGMELKWVEPSHGWMCHDWVPPETVLVELLGKAVCEYTPRVVCASFNAG